MTQRNFEGSKYQSTKDLNIREIAALIRKDLKSIQLRTAISSLSVLTSSVVASPSPSLSAQSPKT